MDRRDFIKKATVAAATARCRIARIVHELYQIIINKND